MLLPDKEVSTNIGAPASGASYYFSGSGNNLDVRMSRAVTLPAGASLSAQVRYDIETDWDYAYRRRLDQRRRDVDQRAHQPVDGDQPQRPELRQRHHRHAPAAPGSR